MMETSILTSTKKVLGLVEEYEVFDTDIIIHINSTFSILQQLGVGPEDGFMIEDSSSDWDDYIQNANGLNMVKSYMFLRVKMLFDTPSTSFLIDATKNQLEELEWRISAHREWMLDPNDPALEEVID